MQLIKTRLGISKNAPFLANQLVSRFTHICISYLLLHSILAKNFSHSKVKYSKTVSKSSSNFGFFQVHFDDADKQNSKTYAWMNLNKIWCSNGNSISYMTNTGENGSSTRTSLTRVYPLWRLNLNTYSLLSVTLHLWMDLDAVNISPSVKDFLPIAKLKYSNYLWNHDVIWIGIIPGQESRLVIHQQFAVNRFRKRTIIYKTKFKIPLKKWLQLQFGIAFNEIAIRIDCSKVVRISLIRFAKINTFTRMILFPPVENFSPSFQLIALKLANVQIKSAEGFSRDYLKFFPKCLSCQDDFRETKIILSEKIPPKIYDDNVESVIGKPGDKGDRGFIGYPGKIGLKGKKGSIGQTGKRGKQGQQGIRGKKGLKGHRGKKGEPGKNGVPGKKGPVGIIGRKGIKGETGKNGITGEPGIPGAPGDRGKAGLTGSTGVKGIKGRKGSIGKMGETGGIGQIGIKGEIGDRGKVGLPGINGSTGNTGFSGEPGKIGSIKFIPWILSSKYFRSGIIPWRLESGRYSKFLKKKVDNFDENSESLQKVKEKILIRLKKLELNVQQMRYLPTLTLQQQKTSTTTNMGIFKNTPALSCLQIFQINSYRHDRLKSHELNAEYWLDPNGGATDDAFRAECIFTAKSDSSPNTPNHIHIETCLKSEWDGDILNYLKPITSQLYNWQSNLKLSQRNFALSHDFREFYPHASQLRLLQFGSSLVKQSLKFSCSGDLPIYQDRRINPDKLEADYENNPDYNYNAEFHYNDAISLLTFDGRVLDFSNSTLQNKSSAQTFDYSQLLDSVDDDTFSVNLENFNYEAKHTFQLNNRVDTGFTNPLHSDSLTLTVQNDHCKVNKFSNTEFSLITNKTSLLPIVDFSIKKFSKTGFAGLGLEFKPTCFISTVLI